MTQTAMDVHLTRSVSAYRTPALAEPKLVRCYTKPEEFRKLFSGLPKPWIVCLESTRQSPAVVRWLRTIGVEELHLVNPEALHAFVKGKPKTDARDARAMLELLVMGKLPECYLAPPAVQDQRALSRERAFARKQSTAVRNAIRALLNQLGLEVGCRDLDGLGGQRQLAELQGQLGPLAQAVLPQLGRLLSGTEAALDAFDAQIRAEVERHPVARALTELPGVGPVLAFGLIAEIGEIERFAAPDHLISYAGLAPKANDSDDYHGPRHLPQRCSKRLRHLAIQAAQGAGRSGQPSKAGGTYQRLRERRTPNVAKLAAARVLLKEVFYRWPRAVQEVNRAA